jgi:transposase
VAIINGTDASVIQEVLEKIPLARRKEVREVSMDMARYMTLAVEKSFLNATKVIDRPEDWTANQAKRAAILFEKFPAIKHAYNLTLSFRAIYRCTDKQVAEHQFNTWRQGVANAKIDKFNTVGKSLHYHLEGILNFFDNRSTNANAESFNSKTRAFRANLRGVTDVKFFLFRLKNYSLDRPAPQKLWLIQINPASRRNSTR